MNFKAGYIYYFSDPHINTKYYLVIGKTGRNEDRIEYCDLKTGEPSSFWKKSVMAENSTQVTFTPTTVDTYRQDFPELLV